MESQKKNVCKATRFDHFWSKIGKIDVTILDICTIILRIFFYIFWCIEHIRYLKFDFCDLSRVLSSCHLKKEPKIQLETSLYNYPLSQSILFILLFIIVEKVCHRPGRKAKAQRAQEQERTREIQAEDYRALATKEPGRLR